MALVLGSDGTRTLVVPQVEHAEAKSTIDRVEHHLEYPGDPRAEDALARALSDAELTGAIAPAGPRYATTTSRRSREDER
jgi:hypothetical protein